MTPDPLPRKHEGDNAGEDDNGEENESGYTTFLQASSRASVPETMAWGARLRISFRAIG